MLDSGYFNSGYCYRNSEFRNYLCEDDVVNVVQSLHETRPKNFPIDGIDL